MYTYIYKLKLPSPIPSYFPSKYLNIKQGQKLKTAQWVHVAAATFGKLILILRLWFIYLKLCRIIHTHKNVIFTGQLFRVEGMNHHRFAEKKYIIQKSFFFTIIQS